MQEELNKRVRDTSIKKAAGKCDGEFQLCDLKLRDVRTPEPHPVLSPAAGAVATSEAVTVRTSSDNTGRKSGASHGLLGVSPRAALGLQVMTALLQLSPEAVPGATSWWDGLRLEPRLAGSSALPRLVGYKGGKLVSQK